MPSTKIAKKLPKRVGSEKLKARRARSWSKAKTTKEERIAEQEKRTKHNASIGCTGKMRLYNYKHSVECFKGLHVSKEQLASASK